MFRSAAIGSRGVFLCGFPPVVWKPSFYRIRKGELVTHEMSFSLFLEAREAPLGSAAITGVDRGSGELVKLQNFQWKPVR